MIMNCVWKKRPHLFKINWDIRCLQPGNVTEVLATNLIRNVRLGRYPLKPRSKPEDSSRGPEDRRQRVDGVVCEYALAKANCAAVLSTNEM